MEILLEGQQIRHTVYGLGVVTESDEDRTVIEFEDHGVKRFVTNLWNAELVGGAPVKLRTRRRRKSAKSAGKTAA